MLAMDEAVVPWVNADLHGCQVRELVDVEAAIGSTMGCGKDEQHRLTYPGITQRNAYFIYVVVMVKHEWFPHARLRPIIGIAAKSALSCTCCEKAYHWSQRAVVVATGYQEAPPGPRCKGHSNGGMYLHPRRRTAPSSTAPTTRRGLRRPPQSPSASTSCTTFIR